jgi:hypothetical protein
MKKGLLDILIEEMNKNRPEGEKVTRMHSEQYQICANGSHKDIKNGKFIKQGN